MLRGIYRTKAYLSKGRKRWTVGRLYSYRAHWKTERQGYLHFIISYPSEVVYTINIAHVSIATRFPCKLQNRPLFHASPPPTVSLLGLVKVTEKRDLTSHTDRSSDSKDQTFIKNCNSRLDLPLFNSIPENDFSLLFPVSSAAKGGCVVPIRTTHKLYIVRVTL